MRKKDKIIWYFKQLLPLTYISSFRESGQKKLSVWKMWFGHCYKIQLFNLVDYDKDSKLNIA